MGWRALCLLALAAALVVSVAPSSAFNYATMSRSAGANIVGTASAYNTLEIVTCAGHSVSTLDCDGNLIRNKGAGPQSYRIFRDVENAGKISSYGVNGGTTVTSGWTGWSAEIGVTSTAAMNLNIDPCSLACASTKTYNTYWTVEGQKAGSLEFTATRILIVIQYP